MRVLTKSEYLWGDQCHKALHWSRSGAVLPGPTSPLDRARLIEGSEVGLLARALFPIGRDIRAGAGNDVYENARLTQEAMAAGALVIYEAAFVYEGYYAAVDILVREADGWSIYEVKASTQVKEEHIPDVAFQLFVATAKAVQVVGVNIITLNGAYERMGGLDMRSLFSITSVHDKALAALPLLPQRLDGMRAMLEASNAPSVPIGPHCTKPHGCPYMAHCWKEVPEPSVLDLLRGGKKAWDLYGLGVRRLEDIPEGTVLSPAQHRQVVAQRSGEPIIDRRKISEFLSGLHYPLHHFDFETFAPAIPLYDRSRPYQQIPFQYSVHLQEAPGSEPTHKEHLADGSGDPREALVKQLIQDIGPVGDVLVYHAQFERDRLKELARDLPHHATSLQSIIDRLVDLEVPFKEGWYYVREMNGSSSIKAVLPALVPSLSYKDLVVQEGGTASMLFMQLASGVYSGNRSSLRDALLAYCNMDTLAMIEILSVLQRLV